MTAGFTESLRGERGAAAFLSRVFSRENILIQPDKMRIFLILLQAFTLNYSWPALVCLLSVRKQQMVPEEPNCTELWIDVLWTRPFHKTTHSHVEKKPCKAIRLNPRWLAFPLLAFETDYRCEARPERCSFGNYKLCIEGNRPRRVGRKWNTFAALKKPWNDNRVQPAENGDLSPDFYCRKL